MEVHPEKYRLLLHLCYTRCGLLENGHAAGDGVCAGIGGCNAAARSADKAVGGAQPCAFASAEWTPPGRKEVALVMVGFMPPQDMLPTYFNCLVIARGIYTNVLLP